MLNESVNNYITQYCNLRYEAKLRWVLRLQLWMVGEVLLTPSFVLTSDPHCSGFVVYVLVLSMDELILFKIKFKMIIYCANILNLKHFTLITYGVLNSCKIGIKAWIYIILRYLFFERSYLNPFNYPKLFGIRISNTTTVYVWNLFNRNSCLIEYNCFLKILVITLNNRIRADMTKI